MPFFCPSERSFSVTATIIAITRVHFWRLILSLFIQARKRELSVSPVGVRCCGSGRELWVSTSGSSAHPRQGDSLPARSWLHVSLAWRWAVGRRWTAERVASSVYLKLKFLCRARAWEAGRVVCFFLTGSLWRKTCLFSRWEATLSWSVCVGWGWLVGWFFEEETQPGEPLPAQPGCETEPVSCHRAESGRQPHGTPGLKSSKPA